MQIKQPTIILALIFSFLTNTFALALDQDEIPFDPKPCFSGCSQKMTEIYQEFVSHPYPPQLTPRVYSGVCYYKSRDHKPHQPQRAMLLIDDHPYQDNMSYFATGFTFFGDPNKYADWDLDFARKRTEGAWERYGPIKIQDGTLRVISYSSEQQPSFIYYMRQNPVTKMIYYITYWGGATQISFCEMTPN